jgi:hypothetical protein
MNRDIRNDRFPCRFPANAPAGKIFSLLAVPGERNQVFDRKQLRGAADAISGRK